MTLLMKETEMKKGIHRTIVDIMNKKREKATLKFVNLLTMYIEAEMHSLLFILNAVVKHRKGKIAMIRDLIHITDLRYSEFIRNKVFLLAKKVEKKGITNSHIKNYLNQFSGVPFKIYKTPLQVRTKIALVLVIRMFINIVLVRIRRTLNNSIVQKYKVQHLNKIVQESSELFCVFKRLSGGFTIKLLDKF